MRELKRILLGELLMKEYPPTELLMDPWLPTGGICELWGPRGGGKTFTMLAIGLAVASGQPFCGMIVPKPRRVLYVDGEMPIGLVQERLRKLCRTGAGAAEENFALLSHAMFERGGIPDLSEPELGGTRLIEREAEGFELIILDNLSSLLRTGVENDAESWARFNEWLLKLRRLGKTVIVVHHSGKANAKGEYSQRGTSRREDQMDSCIRILTESTNPLTCSWMFTKHRSFQPAAPGFRFEVQFRVENGVETEARIERLEDTGDELDEVLDDSDLSIRQIAKAMGRSKSAVGRAAKRVRGPAPGA